MYRVFLALPTRPATCALSPSQRGAPGAHTRQTAAACCHNPILLLPHSTYLPPHLLTLLHYSTPSPCFVTAIAPADDTTKHLSQDDAVSDLRELIARHTLHIPETELNSFFSAMISQVQESVQLERQRRSTARSTLSPPDTRIQVASPPSSPRSLKQKPPASPLVTPDPDRPRQILPAAVRKPQNSLKKGPKWPSVPAAAHGDEGLDALETGKAPCEAVVPWMCSYLASIGGGTLSDQDDSTSPSHLIPWPSIKCTLDITPALDRECVAARQVRFMYRARSAKDSHVLNAWSFTRLVFSAFTDSGLSRLRLLVAESKVMEADITYDTIEMAAMESPHICM